MLAFRRILTLTAVCCVALPAACSNTESAQQKRPHNGTTTAAAGSGGGGVQQITVTTGNDYRFHPSTLVVHPGQVRIVLKNTARSGPPHNLSVTGLPAAFVPLASAGGAQSSTFTAPAPGTYKFICTIHVAQGQTGTLIVQPAA
ncbi:MAG: cupredoxin domain-containing protein [Jatrophihabitans sp.]